jgi:hypothetical protein
VTTAEAALQVRALPQVRAIADVGVRQAHALADRDMASDPYALPDPYAPGGDLLRESGAGHVVAGVQAGLMDPVARPQAGGFAQLPLDLRIAA